MNINNLAAVPSIVFGLLGLAVFLNVFSLPRSAPLVGGLTLALMTLPTIIIASRAVDPGGPPVDPRGGAGLGASPLQVVVHHVLPLAMPGILTGTIIGMARALGETAPLLMIGMVAFIVDVPAGLTDAATALPVQIFLWADSPERAFVEKTSGAIIVLLALPGRDECGGHRHAQRFEKRLVTSDDDPSPTAERRSRLRRGRGPLRSRSSKMRRAGSTSSTATTTRSSRVDMDICADEVTALIGPSGCGKSTFLRCFNRMNDTIAGCRVDG